MMPQKETTLKKLVHMSDLSDLSMYHMSSNLPNLCSNIQLHTLKKQLLRNTLINLFV